DYGVPCALLSFPTRRSSDLVLIFKGRFNHPDSMQLPALALRVHVMLHELFVLLAIEVELVRVVGNVHFFSADKLKIESVLHARRSEEHTSELQSRENLVCRL